ncbi:MAG: hypothetical protein ACFFG0_11660, partial [Candidatus Thorarchaeota archaeon]
DIIGISINEEESLKLMLPFIKRIKIIYPDIKIVVGGISSHFFVNNKKYILDESIDFTIFLEGEEAFASLIKALRDKTD